MKVYSKVLVDPAGSVSYLPLASTLAVTSTSTKAIPDSVKVTLGVDFSISNSWLGFQVARIDSLRYSLAIA